MTVRQSDISSFMRLKGKKKVHMAMEHGATEIIYGTDQFFGEPSYWNKGIGTRLVSAMVKYLIEEKGANRIVMDPQTWNERAIRCYEKCGFEKVNPEA